MTRGAVFASLLSLAFIGAVAPRPVAAAVASVPGFAGETPSSVAGCPYVVWRLARHDDTGQITGIAYYSDLSGLSMVNGTFDRAGQFQLKLTSSMGHGPVGTVSGKKSSDGAIAANMTGEGCANVNFHMKAVNLNEYHTANG